MKCFNDQLKENRWKIKFSHLALPLLENQERQYQVAAHASSENSTDASFQQGFGQKVLWLLVTVDAETIFTAHNATTRTWLARKVACFALDFVAGESLKGFVRNIKAFSAHTRVFDSRSAGCCLRLYCSLICVRFSHQTKSRFTVAAEWER